MSLRETHVIILAAGRGSRLGELGERTPKWLLDVAGAPIADRHLAGVLDACCCGAAAASVRVVTGHAASAIEEFLRDRKDIDVEPIFNPEWHSLNNWYSVLVGIGSLEDLTATRVIVVNADLFAEPRLFAQFLVACRETDAEALIGVDVDRVLTDESMKVAAARSDGGAMRLTHIGKTGVSQPVGEYIGLLMAQGEVLSQFLNTLRAFVDRPEHVNEWYERAVGVTAARGAPWTIWPTPDSRWVEIDDDADYAFAIELALRT